MTLSKRAQQDLSDTLFGLPYIFLILDSSVVGYIHLISPVYSGRKNSSITYFDMMVQTPDFNCRGVSYREDIWEKLIKVEENHSPIKRINIKRNDKL